MVSTFLVQSMKNTFTKLPHFFNEGIFLLFDTDQFTEILKYDWQWMCEPRGDMVHI